MKKIFLTKSNGFTLIELLVVLGLFSILTGFAFLSLNSPQNQTNTQSAIEILIADIKSQQIKAMSGDTQNSGTISSYGIYLSGNSYTLFRGSAYNPNSAANKTVNFESPVALSTNITLSQIVFSQLSGEIINYQNGSEIRITNNANNQTSTVAINRFGAVKIN